ncbi:uncharacterized protein LOC143230728 [Tachypleus tridentatus]|uniref:uncharacterized protein LOC143230728 n=1 Tax=Tachypleus tridentatus TaxID=6853 RepID=UPI003FD171BA
MRSKDYVVQHGLLIPDFQLPQHLENVMNYIISFFSQLHHWLISCLFHQNEQSDSEDEENELETEQEDFEEHEQHQETVEQLPVDLNPSKRKSLSRLRFEESDAEDNNGTHLYVKREREKERELCVVCQDHPKNVILLPCRHFCLCQTCRSAIIVLKRGCPICRQPVLDTLHVFT